MAKRKIADMVADGVLDAEVTVLRTARHAVQAVNRNLRAAKRRVTGRKAKRKISGRKKVERRPPAGQYRGPNARCGRSPGNARCDGAPGKPPRKQAEVQRDVAAPLGGQPLASWSACSHRKLRQTLTKPAVNVYNKKDSASSGPTRWPKCRRHALGVEILSHLTHSVPQRVNLSRVRLLASTPRYCPFTQRKESAPLPIAASISAAVFI